MRELEISLKVSPKQAKALLAGKGCQFAPHQLMAPEGEAIMVSKPVHTKVAKAQRLGKALRLRLADLESAPSGGMLASGEGVRDWLKKLGETAKKVYSVIKPVVAPLVKQGVSQLAQRAQDVVNPFLPQESQTALSKLREEGISELGKLSGLYGSGMRGMGMHGGMMPVMVPTWSTLVSPMHPAFQSHIERGYGELGSYVPSAPQRRPVKGSSFKVI